VPFLLVFTSADRALIVFCFGLLFGFATGVYWANRNFLTLKSIESEDRIYFTGLENVLAILSAIVIPLTIGWFLVLGEKTDWYSVDRAYQVMVLLALLLSLLVGWLPQRIRLQSPYLKHVRIQKMTAGWNTLRWLEFSHGLQHGVEGVLPILLVLTFVGAEGSLGTLQSLSAVLSAIIVYIVGKRAAQKHRVTILGVWIVGLILAASVFSITFSALGVIAYFTIVSLTDSFRWLSLTPMMYDVIDAEQEITHEHHYSYIFDREIYLAIGRVLSLVIFYFISQYDGAAALRYGLLIGGVIQLATYALARKIQSTLIKTTLSLDLQPEPISVSHE